MTLVATRVGIREASGAELADWDGLVRRFDNHRITHTHAWIQSLAACGFGRPLYLVIERDGDVVGCLPGLLATFGPLRMFGSPRAGWQTVSMGPAYDPERVTTAELMSAVVPCLERRYGVRHIELMHCGLDEAQMRAAGFEQEPVFTFRAPLFPGDEKKTFRNLKDSARRNVQRAQRLGLEVRFEHDESFVDEHYAQLREVYRRNRTAIPFSHERILECFRYLEAAGSLRAVSVYLPGGRINIATGMFLVEGRELSLWMWAHREHYRWYRPTELMTWTVMCRAMAEGCDTFDLMGGGVFKTRLGGEPDTTKMRWIRSRPRALLAARRVIEVGFHAQQLARGNARLALATIRRALSPRAGRRLAPACVIGDVDLVRALGLAGIGSVVSAPEGDAARYSRHTVDTLPWSNAWTAREQLVETLMAYGQAQAEPPVLFFDSDAALLAISRHRDRLRGAFRFVVAEASLAEALVDKAAFQALAERLKLPVPPARAVTTRGELNGAADHLSFPAVVKPLMRHPAAWARAAGHGKALRVDSERALRELWPRLKDTGLDVLVQSLIDGDETRIESYHTYVDEKGAVIAEFTGRKIRTNPAHFGDSSALEITDSADVRALGRDVVKRLRLTGVAKLDFKRAADGQLFLLEVNARFTLWHHLAARAGLNIPALVYGDLTGLPRPKVGAARAGARWLKPWTDWPVARQAGMSLPRWLSFALSCDATRAFAWDDPLPLVRAAIGRRA